MWPALVPLIAPFVQKLLNTIPDPGAKAAAEMEWTAVALDLMKASDDRQAKINEIEAGSDSLFKSGWRPACGWLCVFGLALHTVGYPLLGWYLTLYHPGAAMPQVDTELLVSLLMGLLGLGGYRTLEKFKKR
jgi:hypothetical protein